ncbi:MAG: bile acid:sodium symporter family protein [Salibacteraceae bacterium]
MLEIFAEIDKAQLSFSTEGKTFLNATIAFIMFGVALELNTDEFSRLIKKPKPILVGILSQFVLMPLFTFLLVWLCSSWLSPTIGLGMILVSACPGGNVSNFISTLARGNIALSVSLTSFSSLGGIILTPLNFAFWGNLFIASADQDAMALVRDLNIDVFEVLQTILIILALPLAIGIGFKKRFKKLTSKILSPIKKLSIFIFIGLIVIIFANNFELFLRYIPYIFGIVLVHNALAFMLGYYSAAMFGLSKVNRKTIAIETGIQNSGLALALLFNPAIFPEELAIGGMTFIAAWWGVWHIISGLSLAGWWTKFKMT